MFGEVGSGARGVGGVATVDRRPSVEQSKMKIAYTVSERNGQKYRSRIGVAFVSPDGSIRVKLEAVPVNGEIEIRDYAATAPGEVAERLRQWGDCVCRQPGCEQCDGE
jgi:hypothetical protein